MPWHTSHTSELQIEIYRKTGTLWKVLSLWHKISITVSRSPWKLSHTGKPIWQFWRNDFLKIRGIRGRASTARILVWQLQFRRSEASVEPSCTCRGNVRNGLCEEEWYLPIWFLSRFKDQTMSKKNHYEAMPTFSPVRVSQCRRWHGILWPRKPKVVHRTNSALQKSRCFEEAFS